MYALLNQIQHCMHTYAAGNEKYTILRKSFRILYIFMIVYDNCDFQKVGVLTSYQTKFNHFQQKKILVPNAS